MVILTLDSLAALDYENYEVLVIDNNTKREDVWKPVEEYCAQLGAKFRFFHLSPWPGFKAGALNFGLEQTDARAEIVAVVDADYVVRRDWLSALTGHFSDPKVAVVQCPQAHREFEDNAFRRMTAWEYDGFFRIGMHHRNERNAIIQHGTMTMVRKDLLANTGAWSEWTICEDAELGLRLMHAGHELVYVDELMGKGLTPADFTAYKSQRYRWAFGAMQIMKARFGWMVRKDSPLSRGQKFHFLTGWFSWFADALHLVFTMMAIVWTIGMVGWPAIVHPADGAVPDPDHRLHRQQGLFRHRALSQARAVFVVRHDHGLDREHGPQPCDCARHLPRPLEEEGRVRAHGQESPPRRQAERIFLGARGTADVHRPGRLRDRHDLLERHPLHRRQVVDRDSCGAGHSLCIGADRRLGGSSQRRQGRLSTPLQPLHCKHSWREHERQPFADNTTPMRVLL